MQQPIKDYEKKRRKKRREGQERREGGGGGGETEGRFRKKSTIQDTEETNCSWCLQDIQVATVGDFFSSNLH